MMCIKITRAMNKREHTSTVVGPLQSHSEIKLINHVSREDPLQDKHARLILGGNSAICKIFEAKTCISKTNALCLEQGQNLSIVGRDSLEYVSNFHRHEWWKNLHFQSSSIISVIAPETSTAAATATPALTLDDSTPAVEGKKKLKISFHVVPSSESQLKCLVQLVPYKKPAMPMCCMISVWRMVMGMQCGVMGKEQPWVIDFVARRKIIISGIFSQSLETLTL
jgi:hypothetical protein